MRLVVTPFIDETYPTQVVFLAEHLTDDPAYTEWGHTRWHTYYPAGDYIPQVIFGCDPDSYTGYPGVPPTPWITRVEAQRALPTDITITLSTARVTATDWSFTAHVCMEQVGSARTVRVFVGYTIDGFPTGSGFRYRATLRDVGAYEDVATNPGECFDVERTFTFQQIDLDNWATITGVAWAQAPATGWTEAYQAAKIPFLLFGDGFESGDLSGWGAPPPP